MSHVTSVFMFIVDTCWLEFIKIYLGICSHEVVDLPITICFGLYRVNQHFSDFNFPWKSSGTAWHSQFPSIFQASFSGIPSGNQRWRAGSHGPLRFRWFLTYFHTWKHINIHVLLSHVAGRPSSKTLHNPFLNYELSHITTPLFRIRGFSGPCGWKAIVPSQGPRVGPTGVSGAVHCRR